MLGIGQKVRHFPSYEPSNEKMHAARTAAGINRLGGEADAAESVSNVLSTAATFFTCGHTFELTMREVEIQTCGKPFVTVDVMTPVFLSAFRLHIVKSLCLP